MVTTTEMTVLVQILSFVLASMLTEGVQAMLCFMGQEPDPQSHKAYRWVIPVPDPCQCTEVYVGGVSTLAPWRPFKVTYYDDFLHSDDLAEIRQFLNCTEREQITCDVPLGMEDGSIPDASITASSTWDDTFRASNGRLNNLDSNNEAGGWCPAENDWNLWLQVDLGKPVPVEGVITQGSINPIMKNRDAYVMIYEVQYSHDGSDESTWPYATPAEPARYNGISAFIGNTDLTTPVTSMFDKPIQARYIRILPITSIAWHCLRIELIGCKN